MRNENIIKTINILSPLMLDLQKSSARRRFIRHLNGFVEDYNLEAVEIRKKYSEKNPDGSHKTANNLIQYSLENQKKANAEFEKLNKLEIKVTWSGEEKDKETVIKILEGLVEDTKKTKQFNDNTFEYLEDLEGIIKELNEKGGKSK